MNWEYAPYIWSAYAAAAVILPVVATASIIRLRRALKAQAVLEVQVEQLRAGDEA